MLTHRWGSARRIAFLALVLLGAVLLRVADVNPAVAQSRSVTAWRVDQSPGVDPNASVWDEIRPTTVPMTAQQVAVPTGGGAVSSIRARAAHHDGTLFVSVEWTDSTMDDGSGATEEFADAVAIEFPAEPGSAVPAICMGQADGAVNIWQWRADRQTGLDQLGKGADYVDLYPSTDELFYPAQQAGNALAIPGADAIENLVANGFGSLEPADVGVITGQATYVDNEWRAVFARPFTAPDQFQPDFEPGLEFDVAFAVWDGHHLDRDGQKSVSSFVRLDLSDRPPAQPGAPGAGEGSGGWGVALTVLIVAFGVYAVIVLRSPRPEPPEEQAT